jgi:hypothetical protein
MEVWRLIAGIPQRRFKWCSFCIIFLLWPCLIINLNVFWQTCIRQQFLDLDAFIYAFLVVRYFQLRCLDISAVHVPLRSSMLPWQPWRPTVDVNTLRWCPIMWTFFGFTLVEVRVSLETMVLLWLHLFYSWVLEWFITIGDFWLFLSIGFIDFILRWAIIVCLVPVCLLLSMPV